MRPHGDAIEPHVSEVQPALACFLDRQEAAASRPGVSANLEDVGEVSVELELYVALEQDRAVVFDG